MEAVQCEVEAVVCPLVLHGRLRVRRLLYTTKWQLQDRVISSHLGHGGFEPRELSSEGDVPLLQLGLPGRHVLHRLSVPQRQQRREL